MKHIRCRPMTNCAALRRVTALLTVLFGLQLGPVLASAANASPQNARQPAEKPLDQKACVGTWKASFQGEVFAVLVLKETKGELTGTLNNFDLVFDRDGNLAEGTHKDQGEAPLLNVRVKDGAVYFVVLQKDQYYPSTEWKFVPKNADEAALTPMLDNQPYSSNGVLAKPIRMLRDHPKP